MRTPAILVLLITILTANTAAAEQHSRFFAAYAKQAGVSHDVAKSQILGMFGLLAEELKAGRSVTIKRFGRFYVHERDPRTVRHRKTGKLTNVPAKKYPRFSSSQVLKEKVNQS